MNRLLPADAFAYYVSLGPTRSYDAVALKFEVSKRTVTRTALREQWQGRLEATEKQVRERVDARAVETLEEMNTRHLTTMKLVQRKALDALRTMPLATCMDAVRALSIAVDKERVIRGEPTERSAISVEDVIKREYERWLSDGDEASGPEEAAEGGAEPAAQDHAGEAASQVDT